MNIKTLSYLFFAISTTSLYSEVTTIQTVTSITSNDIDNNAQNIWALVCEQRNRLEDQSQKTKSPLRELLKPEEFKKEYPLIPQNSQLESSALPNNIEIRIATIPDNLNRPGRPYSMVAVLYYNNKNQLTTKLLPNSLETERTLNISANWDYAKKVDDFPKIIIK